MFSIVRLECESFNDYSILEEEDLYWVQLLEFMHTVLIWYHSLLLSDEVQFFNAASQYFCINLVGQIVPVGWRLMIKLFIDCFCVELALVLLLRAFVALSAWSSGDVFRIIVTNPVKPVIGQELLHLFALLSALVPLLNDFANFSNAIRVSC